MELKKDRLYDILETMKKNQLKAVLSHFRALSDHSVMVSNTLFPTIPKTCTAGHRVSLTIAGPSFVSIFLEQQFRLV